MRIAFPTNNQKTIAKHIGLAKGFLIIDTNTGEKFYIENPVLQKINEEKINLKDLPQNNRGLGVGRIVPILLKEAGVDMFIAYEFGDGMIKNLMLEGIKPAITDLKDIDEVLKNLDNLKEVTLKYEYENLKNSRGYGRGLGYGYGFAEGHRVARGYGYGLGRGNCHGLGRGHGCGLGRGFKRGWN